MQQLCVTAMHHDLVMSTQIDASYLSPHVNLASRLEGATKQYGVAILFSEDFYGLLSPEIQGLCRQEVSRSRVFLQEFIQSKRVVN